MVVTVISPESDCIACKSTKLRLSGLKIPYESITADDQMISSLKEEGHSAFPVVRVDDGESSYSFSGFRFDRIKELADKIG